RAKFIALVLGQGHTIAYVHLRLLIRGAGESIDESNVWRTTTALHAQAGTVSGLHRRLHARQPQAARRSRHPAPLRRHSAIRPSDDSYARARRPDPAPTQRTTQYRGARAARALTRLGISGSTSQNLCAEVLVLIVKVRNDRIMRRPF